MIQNAGRAAKRHTLIVMGMDEEIVVTTKIAVREMIDFLKEKGLSKDDAYMLTSVAADFHITQLVDGKKGVHGMILKWIFGRRVASGPGSSVCKILEIQKPRRPLSIRTLTCFT